MEPSDHGFEKSVSRAYITDEIFAERSEVEANTTGPINAIASNSLITASGWDGHSLYEQLGTSGVSAMQLSVVTDRYVIIYDKAENNSLKTSNGVSAWSVLLDTQEHTVRALKVITNSFCAGNDPFSPISGLFATKTSTSFVFEVAVGSAMVPWPALAEAPRTMFLPRMVSWAFGCLLPKTMVPAKSGRIPTQ